MTPDPVARGFKGAAIRLCLADIQNAAASIGADVPALRSLLEVETSGSGFDDDGRPKALFEPHLFYRFLLARREVGDGPEKLLRAVDEGLAYEVQGTKPYPPNSYPRIFGACCIDETAALRATSWGLGQVLGDNCNVVRCSTPQALVEAAMDSEAAQLAMVVAYLTANGLAEALRAHDWPRVAAGYNGPAYARGGYDRKLADAYARLTWGSPPPMEMAAAEHPAGAAPDPDHEADALNAAELAKLGGVAS